MKKWLDKYQSKGEVKNSLNRKVTCSNCGWSWKLSDGGEDPLTCHKCGGTIKMKNGGELDKYKEKGEVKQSFRDQLLERNKPIVDASAAPILLPTNLNYDKTRVVNGPSAGLTKTQLKNVNQNLKNRAEQEKKQKLEEYKAAKLFHENNPVAKVLGTRKSKPTTVKPTTRELLSGLGAGINDFYDVPGIGIANDFVNPLSLVSKGIISPWAQAPLQAQQSDSYLPYLGAAVSTALTVPMVRPASITAKTFLNPRNIYTDALKTNAFLNRGIKNKKIIPETNIVEIPKNKENVKSLTDRLSEMLFEPEEKKSFGNMITDEIETNNFVKNYNKNFKKRYKDYSDFKKEYTDFYNEQVNVFGRTPEEVDPEGIMKDFSNPDYLNDVLGFNTYPNARRNIARGLTGDYRGAYYNNQLDNGGRQLLPERGEGIFKLSADDFGKYEQAKPWEVFDKNHFIRQNKYGGQWLDEYKEKGEVKSTFNPYANVNRVGTSDNTKVFRLNPEQVENAKKAAAIRNEKIVKEYQQNQRSFIGPDKRTKAEKDKSIAARKAYDELVEKQKVMSQQPIYQTLQSTTAGGNNPNAAYNPVIGNTAGALGYTAAGALLSPIVRPAINFMGEAMNAPIQGIPGLTGNNIVNAGFATHGLKSIMDGSVAKPWKEARRTGNPWDYANAVNENLMTALELSPLVGPGYRGALEAGNYLSKNKFLKNASKQNQLVPPPLPGEKNTLKNFFNPVTKKIKRLNNKVADHLMGINLGINDNRPFFEKFPITASQREKVYKMQDDAFEEGLQFIDDYYYGGNNELHPEIIKLMEKIDPAFKNRIFDNTSKINEKGLINDKGFRKNPIIIADDKLISTRSKYLKNEPITDIAKEYVKDRRSFNAGFNHPSTGESISYRNQGLYHYSPEQIKNVAVHETGHSAQKFKGFDINTTHINPYDNIVVDDPEFTDYYYANPNTTEGKLFADAMVEPVPHIKDANGKIIKEGYTWEASPRELASETLAAKERLLKAYVSQGHDKKQIIDMLRNNMTDEQIDWLINLQNLNKFFKETTSPETKRKIIRMLYAGIPATVGVEALNQKKHGGAIITNRGQWDYPGQTTIIPSNQITMKGVPYPVTGVDNLGNTMVMQPGMNYTFPGQYVTEYPMMQKGGLIKYKNKGEVKKAEPVVNKIDPETYTKNQYERSKDFHTKWMTSPMYNKMLNASDLINAKKINKIRFDNLNNTRFVYEPIQPEDKVNTGGDSDIEGVVNIYPRGYNDNVSLLGTHEMSHSIDRPSVLFSGSEPDRVIPYEDVYRIDDYANVNRYNPKSLEDELYHKEFLDRYDYIATPTETRARLNEIRDSANQNKIYDPFTQKVNKKIFKKLTNFKFEKNPNWNPMDDLKSVYTDKQIINLLNTVSKNNKVFLNPQIMDNNSDWEIIG